MENGDAIIGKNNLQLGKKFLQKTPPDNLVEEGLWTIEGDGKTVAEFYIALDIFYGADRKPLIPIPTVVPTYDDQGRITEMSIDWKTSNSGGPESLSLPVLDILIDRSSFWLQSLPNSNTRMFDRNMEGNLNHIVFNPATDADILDAVIGFIGGNGLAVESDPFNMTL